MLITPTSSKLIQARGEIYQLLGALFCEPEAEVLSDKKVFQKLKINVEKVQPGLVYLVNKLEAIFVKYSIQDLLVDHTKIFLGPFNAIAHPYSSIYFGEKGLMTDVTTWVENYYRMCGLNFDYSIRDLPDHIVVELEFMYELIFREWEARAEGNIEEATKRANFQREFIRQHLGVWVGKMCDAIIKSKLNEYYSVLAEFLSAFMLHEKMSTITSKS